MLIRERKQKTVESCCVVLYSECAVVHYICRVLCWTVYFLCLYAAKWCDWGDVVWKQTFVLYIFELGLDGHSEPAFLLRSYRGSRRPNHRGAFGPQDASPESCIGREPAEVQRAACWHVLVILSSAYSETNEEVLQYIQRPCAQHLATWLEVFFKSS